MSQDNEKTCPEPDVFVEFLTGKLEEDQLKRIEAHLAECTACGDTVRSLHVEDTFVDLMRLNRADRSVDSGADTELQSLLEKLESLADSRSGIGDTQDITSEDLQARVRDVESLLSPAETDDELGRLAHYRILKLLGAGGMGVVYQAEDTQLQRLVALKILRPSLGRAARERFLHEARAAAAIDHDHVVTIYNVGSEGPLAYLAMQWLEGETLESRLNREERLSPEEVIQIGSQIAEGLAAAHGKKLIHRDIKPANILLEAGRDRAKILDFGLAQVVDDNPQLTETGMIAGTPAYMSPEQAQGRAVDERSDLFSLGTMLYRMLTGNLPFTATNALATIRAIQQETPTAPRQIDLDVPSALSDLVMDLLEKDPRSRPESAVAVAEAMRQRTRPVRHVDERDLAVSPESSSSGNGNWKILVPVLFAFGGLLATPMVYRVLTDHGEIVVETDDPSIQVEVLQGGNVVKVIDPSSNDTVTIDSGTYHLQLKNAASEVTVHPRQVTLRRRGRQVVTVTKNAPAGAGKTAADPNGPEWHPLDIAADLTLVPSRRDGIGTTISSGDRVKIQADGVSPEAPIDGIFIVEPSGTVALGARYGRFQVAGMTLEQAEEAIEKKLKVTYTMPQVQVTVPIDNTITGDVTRIELKYMQAGDATGYFQRLYPTSSLYLVPDARTNSVLAIGASPPDLLRLRQTVEKMDVPGIFRQDDVYAEAPTTTLYDGKPYSYWVKAVRNERNPERVKEAFEALAELTDESRSETTCQAVFRAMQGFQFPDYYLTNAAQNAILRCAPEHVVSQVVEELREKNESSLNVIHQLALVTLNEPSQSVPLRQALIQQSRVICEQLVPLTKQESTRYLAMPSLAWFCSVADLDDETAQVVVTAMQELLEHDIVDRQLAAAKALARLAPDTDGLTERLVKVIENDRTQYGESAIDIIKSLGPRAHAAVPTLLELLPEWVNLPSERDRSVNGANPRAAAALIEALGEIGPAAKTALPTLRTFVRDDLDDQGFGTTKAARAAIAKIEQVSTPEDASRRMKSDEEIFQF